MKQNQNREALTDMKKNDFILEDLVRPNILRLTPYRCARDDYESGILLDANENSLGAAIPDDDELNRYPSPYQNELKAEIGKFRGVEPSQVFVGVGSDEVIDLLIRIFCRPGTDAIIITPPTYGMYKVAAAVNDVEVINVPLTEDFQLRPEEILEAANDKTRILFLCSPNNPTANDLKKEDILYLIEHFNGIVVVDEAYIDFSKSDSFATLTMEYPNLVVAQTMSKSFGLAGIRLGIGIASAPIIQIMMKVKAPYNINKLTSKMAIEAFAHLGDIKTKIDQIITERDRVVKELETISAVQRIFPSDANFILFRIENAYHLYKEIAESGVVVRYRGNEIHCENTLRMTIGTPAENDAFLKRLRNLTS